MTAQSWGVQVVISLIEECGGLGGNGLIVLGQSVKQSA